MVYALQEVCEGDGGYITRGDELRHGDTALALQLRKAMTSLKATHGAAEGATRQSVEHRETVCIGGPWQHALPMNYGMKFASGPRRWRATLKVMRQEGRGGR